MKKNKLYSEIAPIELSDNVKAYIDLMTYLNEQKDKWISETLGISADKIGEPQQRPISKHIKQDKP